MFKELIALSTLMGFVGLTNFLQPSQLKEERFLIAPPPNLEFFSFGQQMPIADQLWIRAIQDFDYCEVRIAENVCKGNSWLAQMLLTITNLAPDYLPAYQEGGIALSVLVSDVQGASQIFDRGVAIFPDQFNLLYRAAYHALGEEKNPAKAADLFLRAAKLLGKDGDWLYSLANRLYVDSGKKEVALQLYKEMEASGMDEGILKRMRQKLGLEEP